MDPTTPLPMQKDFILIGIDGQDRFVWRLVSLQHTLNKILSIHNPPKNLKKPFCGFIIGSALLGSRYDEQETTLYKVRLDDTEIRFNCEVSPAGPLRATLFPETILGDFNGLFKGTLTEHSLKKNDQLYQSLQNIESGNMSLTWQAFLKQSRQSVSCFQMHESESANKHYGLWIEKLPDTSIDNWEKFLIPFQNENRFEKACLNEDPDKLVESLFGKDFRILKVQLPYFECSCSKERIIVGLARLPAKDLVELFLDGKGVESRCEYCHTNWKISDEDVKDMIKSGGVH